MRNLRKAIAVSMCLVTGIFSVMPYSVTEKAYAAEQDGYYARVLRGEAAASETSYDTSTPSTDDPTGTPSTDGPTEPPYQSPDITFPSPEDPSSEPSDAPSSEPSESPVPEPTGTPVPEPSGSPEPTASPSAPANDFVVSDSTHLFYDYTYTNPVSGSSIVIYGNGMNKKVNGQKVNNKQFVAYTDIAASYNYTVNNNGVVKPAAGKVIVGITKSNTKPQVDKNKIKDAEAAKIARAGIKNGQITVTATGKEKGVVYLWVIDTGSKAVYDCCPVNVQLAPKRLEVQDASGAKLKNTQIATGSSINVCVAGIVSNGKKTADCTYTATVDANSQSYVDVKPVEGKPDEFVITAKGLKNNKNTKVTITFECKENGKKIKFKPVIKK